ncbi:MAG: alpha/beta hydrolase [Alphaproteobacteria bacterium]|jgi:haloacetate dehalogenase|nr:alpha/beta hydrolase [Alphaproteobacteria bacterium]MDP6587963.1 alpha/beta hydrolase [Alphaproteobacteria bacterium]MDP6817782.1 alpha/beta hydrolase [Alphaproteobacteria bacterium]|tara:strand:- start:69 stop:938 length:870 start_codon:yes stop_codon:yes gene_type:complete
MFRNFEHQMIDAAGVEINFVRGGKGPPVLLLHGYPQSHAMWHQVAPVLAQHFTVVAADLRGYGDSAKPEAGTDHYGYSKRASAADQVALMAALGFEKFALVGHDRGARVAHRLALDHAERVQRLALIDIVPTYTAFADTDMEKAMGYYHWFFLCQPFDLPERLIGADPTYYLHWCLKSWGGGRLDYFSPPAMAEYERCFADPAVIHASCEDYRAGATIDLEHDAEDLTRKIACPTLALWGNRLDKWYDVAEVWRARAETVTGGVLDGGHFLPEELPEEVTRALFFFLRV